MVDIFPIIAITNSQNKEYCADKKLQEYLENKDDQKLLERKEELKKELLEVVADQTGKLFDCGVLTIVWARRFAGYKRAHLLLRDYHRFEGLVNSSRLPVQVIWAGKPYPEDYSAILLSR